MKKLICLFLALVMVLSLGAAAFASGEASADASGEASADASAEASGDASAEAGGSPSGEATAEALPEERVCEHSYSYQLQPDSYEATDTEGGYRHYVCSVCGAEYAYRTDPMIYADGFVKQTGEVVEVNEDNYNATNPGMDLWEHVPDGEPHVFWSVADHEWRVYIYGSHETSNICGYNHVTWSAPVYDLSQWRYDGEIFRIERVSADSQAASDEAEPAEEASGESGESGASDETSDAASGEAADAASGEGSGGPGGGGNSDALLFAPDCAYDVKTDTYYLATFEVGNSRVGVYPSDAADGWFEPDDIVFTCTTGLCTDPAVYFEDGVMYLAGNVGNIDSAALSESVQRDIEADGYPVISGSTTFAVIYQMAKNSDGSFDIADTSYCPTVYGTSYLPVMEGLSIRYMEEYGLYVMVYYNNGKVARVDTGEVSQANGLCYMYTDDLMKGEWTYGDNGLGDNVIHANAGQYVRNAETGRIELLPDGASTFNGGNDHGGIVKINGSWYIFGHRQTRSGYRQSIGQKLEVSMSGGELKIGATEMTSAMGDGTLDAFKTWDAGIACYLLPSVDGTNSNDGPGQGNTPYVTPYTGNHDISTEENIDFDVTHYAPVANMQNGAVVGYKYLDFGSDEATLSLDLLVRQAEGYTDGSVDIYVDAPSEAKGGTKLGSVVISADAIAAAADTEEGTDGSVWSWIGAEMDQPVSGRRGVYFVFRAETEGTVICLLDQFRFEK